MEFSKATLEAAFAALGQELGKRGGTGEIGLGGGAGMVLAAGARAITT